ncbi:PREDICTED: uncharacterized protein LOC104703859 [Camelina sativa]|uniref:Uncharacterized protein LOC104703859 n=1 Tax=Camelina sativa TaxID=90675 RepID=A0ABM0SZ56_CAMSA|nr:PREDICTED: uncharacterized protein LOC104703859 [Camelina sativa]XP_010418246.1 PREDICTED: uncharacterized protein LOC104703859 [Camelina sativa]XP_019083655.1 PREDICTED: uncharacterized protein LOC104703859 [Camelina sativa]
MYFAGLSKNKMLYEKRFETYEESSKQNQMKMVTLFGQQVYTAKEESFLFSLRTEAYGTNLFGKQSEKVNISNGSSCLLDLNETPANEPVSNNHRYFFQDLNLPHTEERNMSCEKSGLDSVHEKDCSASPSSCCTAENNTRTHDQLQDSCELVQNAAECLLQISAGLLSQSHDSSFKLGSTSQDQELLNNHEMGVEEPSRSCDSFELHTLRIKETIPEEVCCVTSKATDNFSNKKETGVKLRRGRRMKNFQKEILPEIVSLSRHEIQEDINILEAVLRSREYKKLQGKTKDGKCRPNPRNNKGLTQRYIGRRRQTG